MANEITINVNYRVAKSNFDSGTRRNKTTQSDQTTAGGGGPGYQTIGTTHEAVAFGDIAPGLVFAQNLDATNYVELGVVVSATFYPLVKLSAGAKFPTLFQLASGVTLYAKANTASCNIHIEGYNA